MHYHQVEGNHKTNHNLNLTVGIAIIMLSSISAPHLVNASIRMVEVWVRVRIRVCREYG